MDQWTDGPEDGRTNRRTDTTSYGDAWSHLKIWWSNTDPNLTHLYLPASSHFCKRVCLSICPFVNNHAKPPKNTQNCQKTEVVGSILIHCGRINLPAQACFFLFSRLMFSFFPVSILSFLDASVCMSVSVSFTNSVKPRKIAKKKGARRKQGRLP